MGLFHTPPLLCRQVVPSPHGLHKPPWFVCTAAFWGSASPAPPPSARLPSAYDASAAGVDPTAWPLLACEPEPHASAGGHGVHGSAGGHGVPGSGGSATSPYEGHAYPRPAGVRVRGLRKSFGATVAVHGRPHTWCTPTPCTFRSVRC